MSLQLPPFNPFPILSSDSLHLRNITLNDIEQLLPITTYDAVKAKDLADVEKMLTKIELDYQMGNSISWGIALKEDDKIIGTCGYYRGFENYTGEIGFILRDEYRRKGYMSIAVSLVARFGLKTMGLKHIIAITTQNNKPTIQLLEKLNFIKQKLDSEKRLVFEYQA